MSKKQNSCSTHVHLLLNCRLNFMIQLECNSCSTQVYLLLTLPGVLHDPEGVQLLLNSCSPPAHMPGELHFSEGSTHPAHLLLTLATAHLRGGIRASEG